VLGDGVLHEISLTNAVAKNAAAVILGLVSLACASVADAAISSVLGGTATCTVQPDGERHCAGIFTSFDGAPIDVNVGFPPVPGSGPDGSFPRHVATHCFGHGTLVKAAEFLV